VKGMMHKAFLLYPKEQILVNVPELILVNVLQNRYRISPEYMHYRGVKI